VRAFRFRLEAVARVRDLQERAAAQGLASAVRDQRAAHARLAETRSVARGLTLPDGRAPMGAVQWTLDQSARTAELLRRDNARLAAAAQRADQARISWTEAERRCRALSRLEERRRDRWQRDADRALGAELDDMAAARRGTRRGSG
jgi:flagellar biosynthesis chaperone FliJ